MSYLVEEKIFQTEILMCRDTEVNRMVKLSNYEKSSAARLGKMKRYHQKVSPMNLT